MSHLFSGYSKTNLKVNPTTEQPENGQKESSAQKVKDKPIVDIYVDISYFVPS